MNKSEFAAAFELAHNHDIDWSQVDDTMMDGCALKEFRAPVHVTLLSVAKFIRWQCLYMFTKPGQPEWNVEELNEIASIARKKFTLIEDFKSAIERGALMKKGAA